MHLREGVAEMARGHNEQDENMYSLKMGSDCSKNSSLL